MISFRLPSHHHRFLLTFLLLVFAFSGSFSADTLREDGVSGPVVTFTSRTTAEEVVGQADLHGSRFFVTGASTGLGFETARVLLMAGATVTIACRGSEQLARTKASLEHETLNRGRIETIELDLSKLSSVRRCAKEFLDRRDENGSPLKIHSLIANAGVMEVPFSHTEDSFELTMATNYFGHFSLCSLLFGRVTNRIVLVSSRTHHRAPPLDLKMLNFEEEEYDGYLAYAQSKLALILLAKELNARLSPSIEVFSLHPGVIVTELGRYSNRLALHLEAVSDKNVSQGAATIVYAALEPSLQGHGGAYLIDCGIELPSSQGTNLTLQKELFDETERLTGMHFAQPKEEDGASCVDHSK